MGPCSQQGGHGSFGTMTGHPLTSNHPKASVVSAGRPRGSGRPARSTGWQRTGRCCPGAVASTAQPANPPSFEAGESTHQPSLAVSPHTDTTSTVATSQRLVSAWARPVRPATNRDREAVASIGFSMENARGAGDVPGSDSVTRGSDDGENSRFEGQDHERGQEGGGQAKAKACGIEDVSPPP